MPEFIQIPSTVPSETQTALEYYEANFQAIVKQTLAVLSAKRQILFSPTPAWFTTLKHSVSQTLPPTVSHDLLEAAKWDVIDEYVPSDVMDSREQRTQATVTVITSFLDAFAAAHHSATPAQSTPDDENSTLDEWVDE